MVIWAPRRIKKPEQKAEQECYRRDRRFVKIRWFMERYTYTSIPKIVALRAKLEKHRCVFCSQSFWFNRLFLNLWPNDIQWVFAIWKSVQRVFVVFVCESIPHSVGLGHVPAVQSHEILWRGSRVRCRLYKFVFYMQLQHLTKGLGQSTSGLFDWGCGFSSSHAICTDTFLAIESCANNLTHRLMVKFLGQGICNLHTLVQPCNLGLCTALCSLVIAHVYAINNVPYYWFDVYDMSIRYTFTSICKHIRSHHSLWVLCSWYFHHILSYQYHFVFGSYKFGPFRACTEKVSANCASSEGPATTINNQRF